MHSTFVNSTLGCASQPSVGYFSIVVFFRGKRCNTGLRNGSSCYQGADDQHRRCRVRLLQLAAGGNAGLQRVAYPCVSAGHPSWQHLGLMLWLDTADLSSWPRARKPVRISDGSVPCSAHSRYEITPTLSASPAHKQPLCQVAVDKSHGTSGLCGLDWGEAVPGRTIMTVSAVRTTPAAAVMEAYSTCVLLRGLCCAASVAATSARNDRTSSCSCATCAR